MHVTQRSNDFRVLSFRSFREKLSFRVNASLRSSSTCMCYLLTMPTYLGSMRNRVYVRVKRPSVYPCPSIPSIDSSNCGQRVCNAKPVSNGTRANVQSPPPAAWQQNYSRKLNHLMNRISLLGLCKNIVIQFL